MKSFYLTDAGRVRSHNEDSVTILKNASNEYLLMVADGMGGHRAGEVASSLAVTHFGKRFSNTPSIGSKLDAVNWLNDNASEVNNEIIEYAKKYPNAKGLGTTLVLALLTKEYLIFGNIGDSTGYVLKNASSNKSTFFSKSSCRNRPVNRRRGKIPSQKKCAYESTWSNGKSRT